MNGGAIILAATQKEVKVKYRNTTYFTEPLQNNSHSSCSETSPKQKVLIF